MREDDGAAATPMTGRETGRAPGEREFWCNHPRRGQVSFKPNQIEPVRAVVVETLEEVALSQDIPLEVNGVPVSHLSVNDFSNLVIEMRTINDLILYLDARCSICPELQRTVGIEKAIFEFYVLYRGSPREADGMHDILKELCERRDEVEELINSKKRDDLQAAHLERVSNDLSTRLDEYEEGLDEGIVELFDPASRRRNYLLMQDELCDLVLDERRRLGASLSGAVERVKDDKSKESMHYQAAYLDSKPDFLYVFSSSKGMPRNQVVKQCSDLLQGGLAHYGKSRGLAVNYTQDRDGFETVMIESFKATPESVRFGRKRFSNLRVSDI